MQASKPPPNDRERPHAKQKLELKRGRPLFCLHEPGILRMQESRVYRAGNRARGIPVATAASVRPHILFWRGRIFMIARGAVFHDCWVDLRSGVFPRCARRAFDVTERSARAPPRPPSSRTVCLATHKGLANG